MNQQLIEAPKSKEDKMTEIRRYLRQHPELPFHEGETVKYIAEFHKGKDVEVEMNVELRGIKVTIDSGKPGRTLATRTDFDALPIIEDTGLSPVSQNKGVMHACGRDVHTAYMLVLAETLVETKDGFIGKVVVIHQPAEGVPPGGVKAMIENDVLDGVDHVSGVHAMNTTETGNVYYRPGYVQTGCALFKLKAQGKGGHGSSPYIANDVIVADSCFVIALQTVVSGRLSPSEIGVVTIDSFDGRGQSNVIKDVVEIEDDVRGLTDVTKATIEKEIRRLSKRLEALYGITCTLEYNDDYPALYNDPELTEHVAKTLKEADFESGVEICEPQPPSEDFAYYAKERLSAFTYTGVAVKDGEIYPHHHPKFKISEKSLLILAEAAGAAVLDYLKGDN